MQAIEWALRIVRGLCVGTLAAMAVLSGVVVADSAFAEAGGHSRATRESDGEGIAAWQDDFEATTNWLTFAGGLLWGMASPRLPGAVAATAALRGLGAGLVVFVAFYAFDSWYNWAGADSNGRPWIILGLAALAALAAALHVILASRRQPEASAAV